MPRYVERVFDELLADRAGRLSMRFRCDWGEGESGPRIDVTGRGAEFLLRAGVPGDNREDFPVDASESSVSLRAARQGRDSGSSSALSAARERPAA